MTRSRLLNQVPEGGTLTPSEIKRAWDALQKKRSKLTERMIAEGRGYERPTDWAKKTDPLSLQLQAVSEQAGALEREARRYAGPEWGLVTRWGSKW